MLLTGTALAVADGEMFDNTGVKPGVHLVEVRAASLATVHSDPGARHHTASLTTTTRRRAIKEVRR
jgi:hypothetical protein